MFGNKYSKALTVILIIALIGVVVGICFWGYGAYKKYINNDGTKMAISKVDEQFNNSDNNNETTAENANGENAKINFVGDNNTSGGTSTTTKKVMYENFIRLGTIEISKTKVSLPILESMTEKALNKGACLIYKTSEDLNKPGNVVLAGHNYRNGKLFSNNKKLSVGDKITIKDTSNNSLSYTIYEVFETTDIDTSFYNRDTNGVAEITLSTCTDDGGARLIILAKANS